MQVIIAWSATIVVLSLIHISSIRSLGIGLPTSSARTKVNLDGMNIHLTVDNDLQYILNDEMDKQFKKTNSEEAYAILMDPNNGKLLATWFFKKNKKNVANPIFQSQVCLLYTSRCV